MRKIFLTSIVLFSSFIFSSCSDDDDDDTAINYSEVPQTAKSFLQNHFVDLYESDILYTKLDKDGTYEVKFKNGIEIDFYPNGVWKEIDLNGNTLPSSVAMTLPEKALSYISSTYPNQKIEDIEKTGAYSEQGQGFKIEIQNDRDIYFDALGNVLKDNNQGSTGKETIAFSSLPAKAQTFLTTYFADQTPGKIELEWNVYEVEYNKDQPTKIELEFFKDGHFKSLEVEKSNDIIRSIITEVSGSDAILNYLDKNHTMQIIEEFSIAATGITLANGGYVIETEGNNIDYKIYFDNIGSHVKTIQD